MSTQLSNWLEASSSRVLSSHGNIVETRSSQNKNTFFRQNTTTTTTTITTTTFTRLLRSSKTFLRVIYSGLFIYSISTQKGSFLSSQVKKIDTGNLILWGITIMHPYSQPTTTIISNCMIMNSYSIAKSTTQQTMKFLKSAEIKK